MAQNNIYESRQFLPVGTIFHILAKIKKGG